jgi:cytochrome c peroxidase
MLAIRNPRGVRRTLATLCLTSVLGVLWALAGCSDDTTNPQGADAELTAYIRSNLTLEPMPATVAYPPDNPPDAKRVALGRLLFFDPILSGTQDVACGTCHHPAFAWADGRKLPIGVGGVGIGPDRVDTASSAEDPFAFSSPRNSPTILDVAFNRPMPGHPEYEGRMFWDGREDSGLELQAQQPIRSRAEMRGDVYETGESFSRAMERLQAIDAYVQLFADTYPDEAAELVQDFGPGALPQVINGDTYDRAIAAYEREICSADSPYDGFVKGDDSALTFRQKRGLKLFFESGCGQCHNGPMLSDYEFHVLGVKQGGGGRPSLYNGGDGSDLGRYLDSRDPADRNAFRTPTLRNVALTAPYFHTGGEGFAPGYDTLRSVIEFHIRGGNDEGLPESDLDPLLHPVDLTEQGIQDLVAFLESLTADRLASDRVDPTVPTSVPSGLTPPEALPPALTNDFGG